ncbi:MAG: hypothetical protein ABEI99_06725 [Halobaculum sp.]
MVTVTGTLARAAVAGLIAAVVMDVPMNRQAEGFTPAYVAASVLRRTDVDGVPFRDASTLHHATGVLAGLLFGAVYLALSAVLPPVLVLGTLSLVAHVAALAVVVAFVYTFFADLVLPRFGTELGEDRTTAVTGQWLRSAVVFGVTVALVFPALLAVA